MANGLAGAIVFFVCSYSVQLCAKNDNYVRFTGGGNPFQAIEKTAVLQETRMFNETPVNARKCTHILTKILYLINQVCTTALWALFYFELRINQI